MANPAIRVHASTYAKLEELAREEEVPISTIVDRVVDAYARRVFLEEANASFAALRADPKPRAEELAERKIWDQTLMDDVHDD